MITASTALYCVLGSPVVHSKSPLIHNAAFKDKGIDAVYLAFEPQTIEAAVQAIRTLGIQGASVTIPFKESVIPHLDWIHPLAAKIGAVNTLVNENGVIKGYNTDCDAAVAPLLSHGIENKTICIVGAGGAARAVAFGMVAHGARVMIANRTRQKAKALAKQIRGDFIPFEDMKNIQAEVVINTTSLGMVPDPKILSYPAQALHPGMVVMDVVYTPLDTCLLKTARKKKCVTIDGLSMFVAQAAAQFKLWTGIEPDQDLMRQTALTH
ncbi:MAG: shikimate dehydrogenase [Desulfobacter sp.]|nr:shikimate dehydrogenase [Desulfobacter sp.]WDP86351.1 MAG: shikimate dehydrogenase [Desulfobacter sp.]